MSGIVYLKKAAADGSVFADSHSSDLLIYSSTNNVLFGRSGDAYSTLSVTNNGVSVGKAMTLSNDTNNISLDSTSTANFLKVVGAGIMIGNVELIDKDGVLNQTLVSTATIADGSVTTAKLADGAVTTIKITDANVTTDKLADASVTTLKLADSNVTTAKLADAAVTSLKFADSNVTTAKLADGAVTSVKLASGVNTDIANGVLAYTSLYNAISDPTSVDAISFLNNLFSAASNAMLAI